MQTTTLTTTAPKPQPPTAEPAPFHWELRGPYALSIDPRRVTAALAFHGTADSIPGGTAAADGARDALAREVRSALTASQEYAALADARRRLAETTKHRDAVRDRHAKGEAAKRDVAADRTLAGKALADRLGKADAELLALAGQLTDAESAVEAMRSQVAAAESALLAMAEAAAKDAGCRLAEAERARQQAARAAIEEQVSQQLQVYHQAGAALSAVASAPTQRTVARELLAELLAS